jgi:hypothetical protein
MAHFTTSAKTLTYYVETRAIQTLTQTFGDKLTGLTQEEKYQLCTATALMLWGCCDSGIGEGDDPDDEGTEIDFADLMDQVESEPDLISASENQLVPEVTPNVRTAMVILQYEDPEILAQLLPAIAEYARDDDR